MITNPLPPQAYTKETLTQAFAWLQSQGPAIRELATTPDILVSLYQKAKLNGESALWPSVQNFKSELKSLAGMMGEFEGAAPHLLKENELSAAPPSIPQPVHQAQPAPKPVAKSVETASASPHVASKTVPPAMDAKTWAILVEVKSEFNLSSEQEALRMLIALGYKKIKSL